MKDRLRIIATGGTFDKQYDEIRGELGFSRSHLDEIMEQVRCTLPFEITYLPLKDSLFMDDRDREALYQVCRRAEEDRLIVIHGTDTMTVSSAYLGERGLTDRHIVFTGAMVPYTVTGSDALFNLGAAVAFVQTEAAGIWICMNGQAFDWRNVEKNRSRGIFESGA